MASAYTPGLKVTKSTIVKKVRILPIEGDVLVEKGQMIKPSDIVAKTELPGEPQNLNLAQMFNYDVSMREEIMMLKDLLTVTIGDKVKEGDLVAKKPGFFGWEFFATKVESPIDGVIDSISDITGQLMIRKPPIPVEVTGYIPGEVIEVIPNEGVVVETHAALVQGIFGVGGERDGEIMMVAKTPDDILSPESITPDCKGKIIVGGSLITADAIKKAEEVGVIGIVVAGIIDQDLIDYLGYEIGVAITGQEDIPLTLITTEGFGKITMAHKTFEMLKSLEGRIASINGATQIRAGVMRPEIIVAHDLDVEVTGKDLQEGMTKGTHIRMIREPYFGNIGTVEELPPALQVIESGAKVRILTAKLENGDIVTVPRANVELIEE